jgi:hypothetical protein
MGLNEGDIKRVLWTFVEAFGATAYSLATGLGHLPNLSEGQAILWGAVVAGGAAVLSLIKNLVLPDTSSLK